MSVCFREVRDHVYGDVLPVPGWNRVGVERSSACLSVDFGSLTGGAPFDVVYDVIAKGAPVVRALYFLDGLSLSRVTGQGRVMM